jgi:hypothetical protein
MRFSSRPPRRTPYRRSTFGIGQRAPFGYPRRRQQRSGFRMLGPFPSYSTRTRGGGRVQVGGCCLPIPLALTVAAGALVKRAVRRR